MRPAPPEEGNGRARAGRRALSLPKPATTRLALLLAAAAVVLLSALGSGALERAEIYFLDGARAMVESGDWLVPRYQGAAFFDKPPLTYWLIAVAFEAFGVSPGSARLVPAAAALLLIVATFALGRRLLGEAAALCGCLVLATTLGFMSFGRVAMSDMLLALFTSLAVLVGLAWRPAASARVLPLLAAVLALGFLTKGPIAVLLPGLALGLLAWRRRAELRDLPPGPVALAAAVFAVLGLGWYVAVYARLGLEPLRYFFVQENLERFGAETYDTGQSALFYGPAYLTIGAPWSLFLPLVVLGLFRVRDEVEPGLDGARFLLAWVALMLLPLSASRGKIDYYLLPLLPAVSLLLGRHFARASWSRAERLWAALATCLMALALALVPWALGLLPQGWITLWQRGLLILIAAACVLVLLASALRPTPGRTLAALASVSAASALGVVTLLVPGFLAAQPNEEVVARVRAELQRRPDAIVASCRDSARMQRDILFETRTAVKDRCDLWQIAAARRPAILLLRENEFASLQRIPELRLVSAHDFLPASSLVLDNLGNAEPARLFVAANFPGPKFRLRRELTEEQRRELVRKLRRAQRHRQKKR